MHRDRLFSDERKTMTQQLVAAQAVVVELHTIPHCIDAHYIDHNLQTVACKVRSRQLQVENFPQKCWKNKKVMFPTKYRH
jgi:hypothetical protein